MRKTIIRIICSILVMLVMITTLSACAVKSEPEYASSITEGILIGMNDNNCAKFSDYFDDTMKAALPEATFEQLTASIKAAIGDYVPESKEFWNVEEQETYTIVRYKAKYTDESADVIVTVSFQEIEGETYVSGLWFDSPKLREQ